MCHHSVRVLSISDIRFHYQAHRGPADIFLPLSPRLETLGAYYSPSPSRPDEPIGHFAVYLGTSPANTDLKVSETPQACRPS